VEDPSVGNRALARVMELESAYVRSNTGPWNIFYTHHQAAGSPASFVTENLAQNASAMAVQNALNEALHSSIGGVTVTGDLGGPYLVAFNQPGLRSLLRTEAEGYDALVEEVAPGDESSVSRQRITLFNRIESLASNVTQLEAEVGAINGALPFKASINYVDQAVANEASARASAVSALAASRSRIFWEAEAPTAERIGDLWFDTDDGNRTYRWDGTTWEYESSPEAATVQSLSDAYLDAQGNARAKHAIYLNAAGQIAGLELVATNEGDVATSTLDFAVNRLTMRRPGEISAGVPYDPVFDLDSGGNLDIRGSIGIGSSYLSQSGIGYLGIRMASAGDLQVLNVGDNFQIASKAAGGADPYLLLNGTGGNSTRITRGAVSLGSSGVYPHILLNRDFWGGTPAIYLRKSAGVGITLVDNVLSCLGGGAAMWIDGSPVATQTWVAGQGYSTQSADLTGYATEQWVTNQGYLTSHQSLANYATYTWINNQNYLTSGTANSVQFGVLRLYDGITVQPSGASSPLFSVNAIATTVDSLSVTNDADIGGQPVATQAWASSSFVAKPSAPTETVYLNSGSSDAAVRARINTILDILHAAGLADVDNP